MKKSILLAFPVALFLTACGGSKSGGGSSNNNVSQNGICSQQTVELFRDLAKKAKAKEHGKNVRYSEIHQSCLNLENFMGGQSCRAPQGGKSRYVDTISYAEVADYCADVARYAGAGGANRPPQPVPLPTPRPQIPSAPGSYSIPVDNLTNQFAINFRDMRFIESDLTVESNRTSCKINPGKLQLQDLRGIRATVMSVEVARINGRAVYNIGGFVERSRSLIKISCRSNDLDLDLKGLNQVLSPIAIIKLRR